MSETAMKPIKLPASAALALAILVGAPTANAAVIFGSTSLETSTTARVGTGDGVNPVNSEPSGSRGVNDSDAGSSATQTLATNATARACSGAVSSCTQGALRLATDTAYADARVTADVGDDGSTLNLDYQATLVAGVFSPNGRSAIATADFLFTYEFEVQDISTFTRTWAVEQRERQGDLHTEFDLGSYSFLDGMPVVNDGNILYSALYTESGDVFADFLGPINGISQFIIQPGVYTFSLYTGDSIKTRLIEEDIEVGSPPQRKMRTEVGSFSFSITPFTPTAVPEPEAWAMLILGFGAAGHALRRRRPQNGRTNH